MFDYIFPINLVRVLRKGNKPEPPHTNCCIDETLEVFGNTHRL